MAERKTLLKTKPLFPIEYGFAVRDIRNSFVEVSKKGMAVTQKDVLNLYTLLSTLEQFIKYLLDENPEIKYDEEKDGIFNDFNGKKTQLGQVECLKRWFGLMNTVVGPMYFSFAEVERYDPNWGTH